MSWRWRVNNRLFCAALGACYRTAKLIEINLAEHKKYHRPILETCIHEDLHRVFPKKSEPEVEELARLITRRLTSKTRRMLTARYMRKLKKGQR